jgi:hypothetical protein
MESALAAAADAEARRPPDFEGAEAAMERAVAADHYSARPWQEWASLAYKAWMSRGGKVEDRRWREIPILLYKAVSDTRPHDVWTRHLDRAVMTGLLLKQLGGDLKPIEVTRYRAAIVEATRRASQLYPTNASLHARLAEASAEIGMIPDAVKEGHEALHLDENTPHDDKKLDPNVRVWLRSKLPSWEKAAAEGAGPRL